MTVDAGGSRVADIEYNGIPVHHADGHGAELSRWNPWNSGSVIAVGDRFLYWIDLACGIIFSDVTTKNPELRYVPLPADPLLAVKFVRVYPRCYCGWFGARRSCARSQRDFTITTWTLAGGTRWEEDCVLDSGDLWAAQAVGVPLVPPAFPFVSVEDPDVVCFVSSESIHRGRSIRDDAGDKTAWLVAVDMRRKTLRSVCRYPEDDGGRLLHRGCQAFLPSDVSSYFSNICHGGDNPVPSSREDEEEMMEVLAAIREIPGMAREEMLRAHSVLAGDDRRVRFLAALPVGMRKEYCMIMTELESETSS